MLDVMLTVSTITAKRCNGHYCSVDWGSDLPCAGAESLKSWNKHAVCSSV